MYSDLPCTICHPFFFFLPVEMPLLHLPLSRSGWIWGQFMMYFGIQMPAAFYSLTFKSGSSLEHLHCRLVQREKISKP